MNIYLEFLGCRLNEAEQASWQRQFNSMGHQVVQTPLDAHVMAVNTCAVTSEASKKSRRRLRDLHRSNPTAKVVATGCYTTLVKDSIAEDLGVDMVVPNTEKASMAQQIIDTWGDDMPALAESADSQPAFAQARTRAFLKVQDGCHNRCSFCIVSTARGSERSHPIQQVIDEINDLHRDGYQEVVLAGVHLGGYGSDTGENLRSLLDAVLKDTSIPRVRLGSLEPWDFPDAFMEIWDNPRMCPHLHLPLQSGSNTVLRRMVRRCSVESYENLVHLARVQNPNFQITSDLIVGFPGETEAEFRETQATLERIGFGDVHLFSYSLRQGTPAARMKHPLPKQTIRQRIHVLKPTVQSMKMQFLQSQIGRTDNVLWERDAKDVFIDGVRHLQWTGYTKNYVRTFTTTRPDVALFNQITPVEITDFSKDGLIAHLL